VSRKTSLKEGVKKRILTFNQDVILLKKISPFYRCKAKNVG
jgi:hypothetical protein